MIKIIVTGASGFLGQYVLARLKQHDVEVVGVSRGHAPGLFHVPSYADAPSGDVLIHLGEANDRGWVNSQGAEYEREVSKNLKALLDKGFGQVVYSSSSVLYGDQNISLSKVSDEIKVSDVYTSVKYKSEQAVLEQGGIAVRLANLYGRGMSQQNVLSAALNQLSADAPMSLHNLKPIRDFLWVGDAADALVKMALSKSSGIFNLGTGVGVSIHELAELILVSAKQKSRTIVSKLPADDTESVSHLVVDISETTKEFEWQPQVALSDGLETLVNS
ncbi:MAG: NAD(P)-dependent oxidoreductase [Agarilytica sp.]